MPGTILNTAQLVKSCEEITEGTNLMLHASPGYFEDSVLDLVTMYGDHQKYPRAISLRIGFP